MTKFSVAAGIALALAAGSALAADLPTRKAPPAYIPPPPPAFSWTGLYGGINIGYGFGAGGTGQGSFVYGAPSPVGVIGAWTGSPNLNGVTGGGQIGYNYQFSPWLVLGAEADIQAADINTQQNYAALGISPPGFPPHAPFVNSASYVDWWGSVRGRVGLTMPSMPNLMVYGTGGFAYGQVNQTVSVADMFPTVGGGSAAIGRGVYYNTNTGWTAGGGVEWTPMAFPAWSLKVEYLYTNLGNTTVSVPGNLIAGAGVGAFFGTHTAPVQFQTVRAGLNWHFNPFASTAPVLAKY